ncbi:MAG: aldolase/citrate lyase family protein [Steroidobacteraceae bacterium]
MNEKRGGTTWRNPLVVENACATRIARNLLMGSELRRRAGTGFALGSFVIESPTPATVSALALADFDFLVLDMEHSAIDFTRLELLLTAAHAAGIPALVRPWGEDGGLIGKALDMGASGVMVPHVDSADRARAVVAQARYAPMGSRGLCPHTGYDSLREPLRALDEATYVVIQIEGREAIDRIGDIAAVPGIDAVFVGPYDLAMSLGVPPGSPEVNAAADRLAEKLPNGPTLGIYVDDPARCADWSARRFALQVVSFDGRMLANAARAVVATARSGTRGK